MVTIDVFVGKVSIQVLGHVQSAQNAVEVAGLVEDFVRNCEMGGIDVGVYIKEPQQFENSICFKAVGVHVLQNLHENEPVDGDCDVEAEFEILIIFLEFLPLGFGWVSVVPSEDIVKEGKHSVYESHTKPGLGEEGEIDEDHKAEKGVVGKGCLQEAILSEDVELSLRHQLQEGVGDKGHVNFY